MTFESLHEAIAFLATGKPPPDDAGLFGASLSMESSSICLLGVPWDVTTSFQAGTSNAPEAIRVASHQLDLYDHVFGAIYEAGIHYFQDNSFKHINENLRPKAERVMESISLGVEPDNELLKEINSWSRQLNQSVEEWAKTSINAGKKVGLIGGDHSVPFGLFKALSAERTFGILHIDAHHDLRVAYEGFQDSHASIFYNALEKIPSILSLVSVGIRDYSKDERDYAAAKADRIRTFYDEDLQSERLKGVPWDQQVTKILTALPQNVHISIDIDGLDQAAAPHTGTPVPGGLSYQEVVYLIHRLAQTNKEIIGFDLVEVGPHPWDANVAARLTYKLCGLLRRSQAIKPT